MKLLLSTLLAAVLSLSAADLTGTWAGSFTVTGEQEARKRSAHMVLKQEGSKVTGTAGPNDSEQEPIQNGKVEDGVFTFNMDHGDFRMTFRLKQDGDNITGQLAREGNGQKQTAEMALQRQK